MDNNSDKSTFFSQKRIFEFNGKRMDFTAPRDFTEDETELLQLIGDLAGKVGLDAALYINLGQFFALECRLYFELRTLAGEVGLFRVGLGTDRNILASRHRHRTGDQASDACNQNALGVCACGSDAASASRHSSVTRAA
jgi:hypothetical protein